MKNNTNFNYKNVLHLFYMQRIILFNSFNNNVQYVELRYKDKTFFLKNGDVTKNISLYNDSNNYICAAVSSRESHNENTAREKIWGGTHTTFSYLTL